jgi:hypothetical protein
MEHCRLTNRCSGRGHIKCSAAGGRAKSAHERRRARVLTSQPAAAELSRWATGYELPFSHDNDDTTRGGMGYVP